MTRDKAKLATGFVVALLIAVVAWTPAEARTRIEIGSILVEITQGSPQALVGLAISFKEDVEQNISYSLPKLTSADTTVTVPLFVLIADIDDAGLAPVVRERDTLLVLTNTNASTGPSPAVPASTGASVTVRVTFRQADGTAAVATGAGGNPVTITIAPTQTATVSAITQLNP